MDARCTCDRASTPNSERHEKTGGAGGMQGRNSESVSEGEQVEAAEREAARRRLLIQAEAERVPVEETTRAVPDRRWRRERW